VKLWLRILLMFVAVGGVILGLMFWLHAEWRAAYSIAGMQIRGGEARIDGKCPGDFGYNTYLDHTHHAAMEWIYASACRKLEKLAEGKPLQSYEWDDNFEGWPNVTTVLQLPHSYFSVTAYDGNDSDGVSVFAEQGTFSAPMSVNKPVKLTPLKSWDLPEDFLKSEWSGR